MNNIEIRASVNIALIFAIRMFGLFAILPVFTLYAEQLPDSNASLIGLALGIYGFTQALFQMPLGFLSDRLGRKPVIALGLGIFALGSVVAAYSETVTGVVIGRALQGSGAVGSTLMALASDLIRPQERSKSMAIIGMGISLALFFGLGLSPLLSQSIGVPGLFWLTAILAILSFFVLFYLIPNPILHTASNRELTLKQRFYHVLQNANLLRLNFGIFILHATLTALFLVLPLKLADLQLAEKNQWQILFPALLLGFFTMLPLMTWAEKKHKVKNIFLGAVFFISLSLMGLAYSIKLLPTFLFLWIYFAAFTLLEANLPSLISRTAPTHSRGTALGIYSSCQFLGMFVGGVVGGWLYQYYHIISVFIFGVSISIAWLIIASGMQVAAPENNH